MTYIEKFPFYTNIFCGGYLFFTGGQPAYGVSQSDALFWAGVFWCALQITRAIKEKTE